MAAPVSPSIGQFIDKPFWDDEVFDRFTDLYAPWTYYTPTWTGATSNPVLGNGTLSGTYHRADTGKTVHLRMRLVIGSTTTLGSGVWSFTTPSGLAPTTFETLHGFISNSAGTLRYPISAFLSNANGIDRIAVNGTTGVNATNPFAWASNDQLVLTGTYEI